MKHPAKRVPNQERILYDDLLRKLMDLLSLYQGMIRITILRNIALLTHALLTLFHGAEIPEKLRGKLQDCIDQLSEIEANLEKGFVKGEDTYQWYEERKKWYTSELNGLVKELREKYPFT